MNLSNPRRISTAHGAPLLPFDEKLVLPMIPIFKKGLAHDPNESNIAALKDLIARRIDLKAIFTHPDSSVRDLILSSGGHLRDLMKLAAYAANETDDKITPHHANIAINTLVRDYAKVVRDDEYHHLATVFQTQSPLNNELIQELIYNNVILVYTEPDGTDWTDVHPAVVKNAKFQTVLREKHHAG